MRNGRVLVTGANGFVGREVVGLLVEKGIPVRAAARDEARSLDADGFEGVDTAVVGEVGPQADWSGALEEVSGVVHLVDRTHVTRESTLDPMAEYRRVNVDGTVRLAEQARISGVKRG